MANKLHYDITAKDRTKRVFSALGSSLKKVGKAVFNMKTALVGLAGVAGLGLLVRASLKSIDNLGKLSRQILRNIVIKNLQKNRKTNSKKTS